MDCIGDNDQDFTFLHHTTIQIDHCSVKKIKIKEKNKDDLVFKQTFRADGLACYLAEEDSVRKRLITRSTNNKKTTSLWYGYIPSRLVY